MWLFNKKPKIEGKELPPDKFQQALCDQCCGWLGLPLRKSPKILLAMPSSLNKANYVPSADIIIVYGEENMTDKVLAHEMAHAVLKNHRDLTTEMQEILAGYCEFKITKVLKN